MRSIALFSALMLLLWLSSIALLYAIDVFIMGVVQASWARTLLGLSVFAAWVLAWGVALLAFARKLISSWTRRAGKT